MSISITPNNNTIEAAKRKLTDARNGLKNDSIAMHQVAVFLDQWVQRNFKDKGGKVGGWEPFKYGGRITTKAKANAQSIEGHRWINGSAAILQDTGSLRLSFLPFIRLGVAGIGSELPYSKPHHEGTKDLPERRLLPKVSEVQVDIKEILDDFVLLRIRSANA